MRKKILLVVTGLLILGMAAFYYIDTVFLPGQFKQYVITKSEQILHRRVSIGNIDFKPIQGFIIEDVVVSRKDDPQKIFLKTSQISFNILFAPFFRKPAALISNIKIKKPYAYLARDADGVWNFSDLLNSRTLPARGGLPTVLLRKLDLIDGKIQYRDTSSGNTFFESIEHIHLNSTLSLNKGIRFVGQLQVPALNSTVRIKGTHSLVTKNLTAQIMLDRVHLARYLALFNNQPQYIHIDDGILSSADFGITRAGEDVRIQGAFVATQTDILVGATKRVAGNIYVPRLLLTWRDHKWDASGKVLFPSARFTAASGNELRGDVTADLNLLTVYGENISSQGDVTINNLRFNTLTKQYLSGDVTALNASLTRQNDTVRLQGNFDINNADISLGPRSSLKGDIATVETHLTWSAPDEKGNRKLDVESGLVMNNARVGFGNNHFISGNIRAHNAQLVLDRQRMTVQGQGQITDTDSRLAGGKRFLGSPDFDVYYRYDPGEKNPVDYKAGVHFTNSLMAGIPYFDKITGINGSADIIPDQILMTDFNFRARDADFLLSGKVENFSKPAVHLHAESRNIDLQKYLTLFPSLKNTISVGLTGQAGVQADYDGPAASPEEAKIKVTADLNHVSVRHDSLPKDITDVFGRLEYSNDLVTWKNLKARYGGGDYTLNGQLSNFSRPVIDAKIFSDSLSFTTQVKILNEAFQLTVLKGNYRKSLLNLKGDVHLFEGAPPDIDLRGKCALNVSDLGYMIPRFKDKAARLDLKGVLNLEGVYKGRIKDWRNWQLSLDGRSDKITAKGLAFKNIIFRYSHRDMNISKCDLFSDLYGGTLKITSSADLREKDTPFKAAVDLAGMDLSLIKQDKKIKNKNLAGIVTLSSVLSGDGAKWREMTGKGSLKIADGYLWQWDVIEGMSSLLLIPEFKTTVFTDAHADFKIHDRKINTGNAQMIGKQITLNGKGWVDFDQNLNFDITPVFSEIAIIKSKSARKGTTSILTQTDGYLNIKLTGTLFHPHHTVEKSPGKILEKTLGGTTATIKEMIDGIVDEIF